MARAVGSAGRIDIDDADRVAALAHDGYIPQHRAGQEPDPADFLPAGRAHDRLLLYLQFIQFSVFCQWLFVNIAHAACHLPARSSRYAILSLSLVDNPDLPLLRFRAAGKDFPARCAL